ncbi:MAG TPA: hypothetical protein VFC00_03740 [Micromonosporaceae bacterium]|nr:hypothetical protein [Micromonosporaceae bacterium]
MIWAAILSDPVLPFDRDALRLVVRDQRRWSRRWLYPVVRVLSRIVVTAIVVSKRLLPVQFAAHSTMDRLCVWFLRRCVSPDAGTLLIRHFVVETNLLAFIARNAGVLGVPEPDLRPVTLRELGNRAVIEHDLNVYRLLTALGAARRLEHKTELDFTPLRVPPIDAEPAVRRLVNLDIQTALCLMNIPFALCLTAAEYRRAVHSLRLDESIMAILATLTGDPTFRTWCPAGSMVRVDSNTDVPRAVYEHAVICEYAHAHLLRLAHHLPN